MKKTLCPSASLTGALALPGDKSISHRYAILSALAEGVSKIENYSSGADCHSTLNALRELGIRIEERDHSIHVHGAGLRGWSEPSVRLDAGNSGSAMRMLAGPLAAQSFTSTIIGDESLSRRPMDRIIKPLAEMGGSIEAREGRFPPLIIHGQSLKAIDYTCPVASAQVKTCLLLAGLFCQGETIVTEPVRTRDHTEVALVEFGADVEVKGKAVSVRGPVTLKARDLIVPADLSSAAFFLVAASIVPNSQLILRGVGLNPTRSMLLDFLLSCGARIRPVNMEHINGETRGDLHVSSSDLSGGVIEKALAASLIDEIPVLSILGAVSRDGLVVRDARELRVKETDRIATVVDNLRRMGISVEDREDGFTIQGGQKFRGAVVDSFGDHRIAMAFAVAALVAQGETVIEGAEAASVSFPEFYDLLDQSQA
jgi:3-phosphoshikimate 1-carboxyvinyltransferase